MPKTTYKAGEKPSKKTNIKENAIDVFNTAFITGKIIGIGGGGAYLITNGYQTTNAIMIGLGAVLLGYGIVVLISIAHTATKSTSV